MAERIRDFLTKINHKRFAEKDPQRKVVPLETDQSKKDADIGAGIEKVASLLAKYPEIVLNKEEIESDLLFLEPLAFGNPMEAINSQHDIRHNASVYALSRILARVVKSRQNDLPNAKKLPIIDEDALRLAAPRHDILRLLPDGIESIPPFNKIHGRAAGRLIEKGSPNPFDFRTVATASQAASYHDYHHTPESVQNPTLELLVDADRLELVRMHYDKLWGNKRLNSIFTYRMHHYNAKYFPGLIKEFEGLAKAMYLLSAGYINEKVEKAKLSGEKVNPKVQTEGVIYALGELGLLQAEKEQSQMEELLLDDLEEIAA